MIEELVAQGNEAAISLKISGLTDRNYGYESDHAAARELNDALVAQGNDAAILRKACQLVLGNVDYMINKAIYPRDLVAAEAFLNQLQTRDDFQAHDYLLK